MALSPIKITAKKINDTTIRVNVSWNLVSGANYYDVSVYTKPRKGKTEIFRILNPSTSYYVDFSAADIAEGDVIYASVRTGSEMVRGSITYTEVVEPPPPPPPPPPPTSSIVYPNEPAGFVRIAEHDFAILPGVSGGGQIVYGDSETGPAGAWWQSTDSHKNLSLGVNGGGGPLTDTYLRIRYPVSQSVGTGPVFICGWGPDTTGGNGQNQQRKLYIFQRLRFIGPPEDPFNWEVNAVGTKFNYTGHTTTSPVNQSPLIFRPHPPSSLGSLALRPQYRVTLYAKSTGTTSCGPYDTFPAAGERGANVNPDAAILNVGEWVNIEQLFELNDATCPPTANGRFRVWINGILTHDYPNWSFRTIDPLDKGFMQYRLSPVYGGVDKPVKSREDYIDLAHVYVSGVPL